MICISQPVRHNAFFVFASGHNELISRLSWVDLSTPAKIDSRQHTLNGVGFLCIDKIRRRGPFDSNS